MKVSQDALDFALSNVEGLGDTDIFPVPFEYQAIRHDWDRIRTHLAASELNDWVPRPLRRSLVPKQAFGFRIGTQLDPLEHLVVSALVFEAVEHLESVRLGVEEGRVHSYRFTSDAVEADRFYDFNWNFSTYHKASVAEMTAGKWVVLTDISDFYLRIYLHPLENTLAGSGMSKSHARTITQFIKAWSQHVSYGVPIGPAFSRILAEATISDVDHLLRAEGLNFFRFSDDYRIVVDDQRDGYRALEVIAQALHASHGLTLNASKTEILPVEKYLSRWQERADRPTVPSLRVRWEAMTGFPIDFSLYTDELEQHDLPAELLNALAELDLPELLRVELNERSSVEEPDYAVVRFILSKLHLLEEDAIGLLLEHSPRLHPIASALVKYLLRTLDVGFMEDAPQNAILTRLTELVHDPAAGSLPFHRAWWLEPLRHTAGTGHEAPLVNLFAQRDDDFTRPQALLAMARQGGGPWLRAKRRDIGSLPPWTRRALLRSVSMLPHDERTHWYKAVGSGLDELEAAVVVWSRANPIQ